MSQIADNYLHVEHAHQHSRFPTRTYSPDKLIATRIYDGKRPISMLSEIVSFANKAAMLITDRKGQTILYRQSLFHEDVNPAVDKINDET